MSDTRPNILLVMTDQQRGDCLGCAGHPAVETPYIDQLAGQGVRFRHAYSAVPSCVPARASLMTGMDQWHTGILGMGKGQRSMRSDYPHTLPGELAKAGYHTQGIGKMHFNPQRALYGFHNTVLDESSRLETSDYRIWFERNKTGPYTYRDHSVEWNSWMARPSHLPEHLHPTWWTAQQGIEWLNRRDPERPFFLKLSFARPHSPYDAPQPYFDMYRDADIPQAAVGDWADMNNPPREETSGDAWHEDSGSVNAWRGKRTDREIRRARQGYYGNVTFIDHQIGRVLYEMGKYHREALNNTLIIFLSDHGDMLGDHHLWRKTYAYEGSARVPMVVSPPAKWRDARRGQVRDEVIEIRDIMPTILDAAGVDVPATCQGHSMLPMLRGETPPWRDYLHGEHVWCYGHEQAMHYVTDGREKFIWLPYLGIEQFFDLNADPNECHNLAGDDRNRSCVALWRQRLIDELKPRATGEVKDDRLVKLPMDAIVQSPYRDRLYLPAS